MTDKYSVFDKVFNFLNSSIDILTACIILVCFFVMGAALLIDNTVLYDFFLNILLFASAIFILSIIGRDSW